MTTPSNINALISTNELARMANVSTRTIRRWRAHGLITPAVQASHHRKWHPLTEDRLKEIRAFNYQRMTKRQERSEGDKTKDKPEPITPPFEGALTNLELSALCGVPESTINRWVQTGLLERFTHPSAPRKGWYKPLTDEEVQAIRAEARSRQRHVGASTIRQNQSRRQNKLSLRPSPDHMTAEEAAEMIGEAVTTVRTARKKGKLANTMTGQYAWYLRSDVEAWNRERLAKKVKAPNAEPAPKTYLPTPAKGSVPDAALRPKLKAQPPKPVVLPRFTPAPDSSPAASPRTSRDFGAYDAAVEAGKANPAFQGPLGFNVLHNSQTGAFRPAPVSVIPQDGWNYHQRHYKNGLGQWQIRTMGRNGEVHL